MRMLQEIDQFESINPREFPFLEWAEKYIPFKIMKPGYNDFVGRFEIPGSYAPAGSGHSPDSPIAFMVKIQGSKKTGTNRIQVSAEDVWNKTDETFILKLKSSGYVTYSNSLTSMQQANFEGNIVFLIYATVVKIIDVFCKKFNPDLITFGVAHAGLSPIYYLLCLRAEKTFGYKYINPRLGRASSHFDVVSPEVNRKMKAFLATRNPTSPEEEVET